MPSDILSNVPLSDEARGVIWHIFGSGASPLSGRSTYELIEPIIRKRVCLGEQDSAVVEIRGWFEATGSEWELKSEMSEPVAMTILDGVGTDRSETATWAIGSIDGDLAARVICSRWQAKEIDSFVETALTTLERLCAQDEVLDATRVKDVAALGVGNAKIPKASLVRRGRLETFRNLYTYNSKLVLMGLHPAVDSLIRLVIQLRPRLLKSVIERLDHPVIRARVADLMIIASEPADHRKPLQWITADSCDALVALAIVHTLNTVNSLDADLQFANHANTDHYIWSTELRFPRDDMDAAGANIITGLVDRLAVLAPLQCARWIGELLSNCPYMLHQASEHEAPLRVKKLESACTELLARLVHESWSEDLSAALCAGLRLTPRTTWTRHLADLAWAIRDVAPARAAQIARATLDEDQRYVDDELKVNHLFLHWDDWHTREWFSGLGDALALSNEELDLPHWVSVRCRALPLSVWDAEENHQAFDTAHRAAQHWFLVAFHAVASMRALGRAIHPSSVRILSETLWDHCHFAGQFRVIDRESPVAVEHAARFAVEYGDPSDTWLLDQVRNPRAAPHAIWALIDQRMQRSAREARIDAHHEEMTTAEIIRVASERVGDGTEFDLEELQSWGKLWLLLDAIDEAERTAMEILGFPRTQRNRANEILVLKLLALVASKRTLAPLIEEHLVSTYRHLWSGYTPNEEGDDRRRIDELLERSRIPM